MAFPISIFFGYLQICHYIKDLSLPSLNTPKLSAPESFLINCKKSSHFISSFYNLLHDICPTSLFDFKRKWERDLDNEYIEDNWQEALNCIRNLFSCNRLRETQYKILHRLHITPFIRNKMDPDLSPQCLKCHRETGDYIHLFWKCKYILRFWSCIARELSGIFKTKVTKDPGLFLLGLQSKTVTLPSLKFKLLDKLLLLARKCILLRWIGDKPTVTMWYKEIFSVLPHERITAELKENEQLFLITWQPLMDYLPAESLNLLSKGFSYLNWKPSGLNTATGHTHSD